MVIGKTAQTNLGTRLLLSCVVANNDTVPHAFLWDRRIYCNSSVYVHTCMCTYCRCNAKVRVWEKSGKCGFGMKNSLKILIMYLDWRPAHPNDNGEIILALGRCGSWSIWNNSRMTWGQTSKLNGFTCWYNIRLSGICCRLRNERQWISEYRN